MSLERPNSGNKGTFEEGLVRVSTSSPSCLEGHSEPGTDWYPVGWVLGQDGPNGTGPTLPYLRLWCTIETHPSCPSKVPAGVTYHHPPVGLPRKHRTGTRGTGSGRRDGRRTTPRKGTGSLDTPTSQSCLQACTVVRTDRGRRGCGYSGSHGTLVQGKIFYSEGRRGQVVLGTVHSLSQRPSRPLHRGYTHSKIGPRVRQDPSCPLAWTRSGWSNRLTRDA